MNEQVNRKSDNTQNNNRQAGGTSLPRVTMNMLSDFLVSYDVEYFPEDVRRVFHWFDTITCESAPCTAPPSIADANLLYICSEKDALELLRQKQNAFVVILCETENYQHTDFEAFRSRILIIKQRFDFAYYILQFQSYFTSLLVWENELKRIVSRRGTLTEMLDATTLVISNFLFVSDASLNVIAYSSLISPPDELHRRIVKAGRFTPDMLEEKLQRLPENESYVKEPSRLTPSARLSQPIYLDHIYFGSLSMSCCNTPLTEGLRDLFKILLKYIAPLCAALWRTQVKLDSPHYFFFEKILTNTRLSDDYLKAQTKLIGIDKSSEFLLVSIYTESTDPAKAAQIMRSMGTLNQGRSVCFPYQSKVLALCHSPENSPALSPKAITQECITRICKPFDAIGGVSDTFSDITDLDLAYRQTTFVLDLRETFRLEAYSTWDAQPKKYCHLFSEAIEYYLVNPGLKDKRFIEFCFDNTLLKQLHDEDVKNGTKNFDLLWTYVYLGRNATSVANRLHMHRNTVLYHIEKIQKRFDLDLSSPIELSRMMLSFKAFFLLMAQKNAPPPDQSTRKPRNEPPKPKKRI